MKNKVMLFYGMFEDNQAYAYIPWSMIYLATYLRKHKFDPIIIDEFTSPEIEEAIKEYAQESITFGVSAMTGRQITAGLEAIRSFKSYLNKEARIVLGGAHSTALPEESLMNESIDYAFSGQSFLSLPLLLQSMSTKQQSEDRRTIYADYPTRQQLLEFPDFELHRYDFEKYINPTTRLLNYSASIGCPASCSFCSWGKGKHTHHYLSLKRVLDDIEFLVKTYDLTTIVIQDSTFFSDKNFVLSFAEGMTKRNLGCFWRADARVVELARFTKAEYKILANSGLDWVFVGVENTVPRIMRLFKKVYNLEMVDTIINNMKGLDIDLFMSLIVGVPTETIDELELNVGNIERWFNMSDQVFCQKCVFTPYPGTELTNLAIEHGFKPPTTLEGWAAHPLFVDVGRVIQSDRVWLEESYLEKLSSILSRIEQSRSINKNTIKPAGTKPKKIV